MKTLDKQYINGAWVSSSDGRDFPIINPATEAQIGTVTLGSAADVDDAVAAASKAFETYSKTTKAERIALFRALQKVMIDRNEEMAQAISSEMGAPITLSRNAQAGSASRHVDQFIAALEELESTETLSNGDIMHKEPIGVCGLITPWNWPIFQIVPKVLPALAAGSTCVLKPSELTPISAALFADFMHEAGFPAGVFNLVFGDGPTVGSAMSCHPDIAMLSFTGSTRAGAMVTRDAAETIKRVTLELGGKSPNIVFADADLQTCVSASTTRCFMNTGQGCNAPTRMLVERSIYDQVVDMVAKQASAQPIDDPAKEGSHIGPLANKAQFERVQSLIQVGIDDGARLVAGGLGRPDGFDTGYFARPTVFADVSNDMTIAREEVFGPVLCIIPFDTEEEAITIANDTDYGLAAYIQTGSASRAARVAAQIRAGNIGINGQGTSFGAPLGGYKRSGNGREGGLIGLEEFLEIKSMPSIANMQAAGKFSAP
ncbi:MULTISPECIES: aldehyde dehydrogenase family protein [Pacificibacter]|uniref:aldehyde dehydrogenase family protein n=1 Tax=Pacificibacter TaxID=1042323 RepID=UPI001C088718|nr:MULTISPECIES: aldehyde dehydrogenase family protein [Pacificibacter]MBU2937028.1 aldehyde dehydrogenase family protein [Pacificibacter marinus]MDO6616432.1 aldehyde dehydrogenase family protein [Pacificibacter sp. 1_MG-2023]